MRPETPESRPLDNPIVWAASILVNNPKRRLVWEKKSEGVASRNTRLGESAPWKKTAQVHVVFRATGECRVVQERLEGRSYTVEHVDRALVVVSFASGLCASTCAQSLSSGLRGSVHVSACPAKDS